MNSTVGQRSDITFNETVPISGNQFCAIALVNNQDKTINFRLGSNNNATVSQRVLDNDYQVDFANSGVYEMMNYTLFGPLGQISNEIKSLPPRRTLILLGANTGLNATTPAVYSI